MIINHHFYFSKIADLSHHNCQFNIGKLLYFDLLEHKDKIEGIK
jgi:hypothetical protein